MHLTTEYAQLIRLLYDIARRDIPSPEAEQVDALLASVELFLACSQ